RSSDLIIYLTIREPDRGRFSTSEQEKAKAVTQEPFAKTMASLWQNRIFVRVVMANALGIIALYGFSIWLAPILMRNFEIPVSQVGDISWYRVDCWRCTGDA